MEAAENTERRYNTRFRGVPRSIFTYARIGKKPGPKTNLNSPPKNDLRDDFIYTKLGKKPNAQSYESARKNSDSKTEEQVVHSKATKKPCSRTPTSIAVPNGVHHTKTESCERPALKVEEIETEPDDDREKEIESPFLKDATSTATELHLTSNTSSKSVWITSKEKLSWNNSNVASYNPKTKMFRCVVCQAVGFMSRIGEHYLGTHCNAKVFHCPQCSYCSAWWRCVRNHMSKNHGVSNAPASMWKNQPLLDEIMQLLQNLKYSVDCEDRVVRVAENSGKRYICPKCPYATDRRDLYNRHENIHREEKPFQCYICYKLFNRADHVKKHFCRIHKDYDYDINLIRRLPSKRSRIPVSPFNGLNNSSIHQVDTPVTSSMTDSVIKSGNSTPITESQLLKCLTGSPTMVKVSREIDFPPEQLKIEKDTEDVKESTFNKSHSNLLSFLTQSAFSPKPLHPQPSVAKTETHYREPLSMSHKDTTIPIFNFPAVQNDVPKEFQCPYCPWVGLDMWALRIHTSSHYKNFCVLCNFKSTQAAELEAHLWECHKKKCCSKCNFLAESTMMLDDHMNEVHVSRHQFTCRHCSQPFEVRSDMEAHCIFIHNQVLQECKQDGCDFCTTDPDVLERHRQENHVSASSQETECASRTQCLYCGCDFTDFQSLSLHEVLFHENPLQQVSRRPLDPYCCSVCGYATPKQPMMMEHMRIHTGQELHCQAGDGCYFSTPYDTVLREHVLQSHCIDDGIVRCPHCGYRCSTRYSFVTHYEELHHPFCCHLCEEVEFKHFVMSTSTCYMDSNLTALFPFSKKSNSSHNVLYSKKKKYLKGITSSRITNVPKGAIVVDTVRRSRKQSQPRKVVQGSPQANQAVNRNVSASARVQKSNSSAIKRINNNFISLYAKKVRHLAQVSLLRCKFCVKCPLYFRHKRNYTLHTLWHCLKRYHCNKCFQTFHHRYQVLLHDKREHKELLRLVS